MHLQVVIKKNIYIYNSKCMSKYKMLRQIICFNVSVRHRNLNYFEEFIIRNESLRVNLMLKTL